MHGSDQRTVTGTGYSGASRRRVRQLSLQMGAKYSGDLIHGVTTHLVCKDGLVLDSEKISVARAWGLPVVQHAWLQDSVQAGFALPVEHYRIGLTPCRAESSFTKALAAKANSYQASCCRQMAPDSLTHAPQTNYSRVGDVEVLRSADLPASCQLADLLLATAISPQAETSANVEHTALRNINPAELSPTVPPPSPASARLSTPDFSTATSIASIPSMSCTTVTSDVHR